MKSRMVEDSSYDSPYRLEEKSVGWEKSVRQQGEGESPDLANTLRSLKAEIISCKADNERLIEPQERLAKPQEKQAEVNVVILQSLSDLQKQEQVGISHGDREEERTNSANGSRSQKKHKMDRDDTVKSGRFLETPNRRASLHGFYSSSTSRRHHHHCHHHH